MDRLDVDGGWLAHDVTGAGDPVVLLHPGFIADGMAPLAADPAMTRFRVVTYHRRGYGESAPLSGPFSLADQATDVVTLLDGLGIASAHIVGHSLGGTIALHVAVLAPERVGTLSLLDPLVPWALSQDSAAFFGATAATAIPLLAAGDHAGALNAFLTGAFGPGFHPALDRALPHAWPTAVHDAPTAFGVELPAVQQWNVDRDGLAGVRAPTLLVTNNEPRWPGFAETHEALLDAIPGCQGIVVAVGSHLLQIADPRAVAAVVSAFLTRHPLT
jgi:3-oxoadipate enol-lactonase